MCLSAQRLLNFSGLWVGSFRHTGDNFGHSSSTPHFIPAAVSPQSKEQEAIHVTSKAGRTLSLDRCVVSWPGGILLVGPSGPPEACFKLCQGGSGVALTLG